MPYWIIVIKQIIEGTRVGAWCKLPYPNHPKGCPNYGRQGCPPTVPSLSSVVDQSKAQYLVFSEYSLEHHVMLMREAHPKWSERQLKNVLYWQGSSRAQLRRRVTSAKVLLGTDIALFCPEAYGLNVYATCLKHGLKLEKIRRLKLCHHVALIGFKKQFNEVLYDKILSSS